MRPVAILFAGGMLASCATPSYFPPSLFEAVEPCDYGHGRNGKPVMDEYRSDWYSSHLRAAREPRLGEVAPIHEVDGIGVLRFTWLRTFHAPVMVRVEATADGELRLAATELSGAGGYDPGRIARRIERRLSADETARLTALVIETRVLDLPPSDDCPVVAETGEIIIHGDGAHWIIEANGPEGYRYIDRWSAEPPVRELGLHLVGLTGWTYDRIY